MQVQELVGIVPWNFIATICNLFIQVYLIKRFLFKPVNEMLEKRRAKADAEIQDAVKAKEKAEKDIAQERRKAVNEIKGEIGGMAVEIAGKVIEREINEEDHTKLINDFIENVGEAS